MLSWTVIIMLVFLYSCAVVATSAIGRNEEYVEWTFLTNGWDADEMFGTVGRSMYTLVQCMTRDGWSSGVARYVISLDWTAAVFFAGFMLTSTYGLLNLVVSIIVEQTQTAAKNNSNREKVKMENKKKAELEQIREIFMMADEDGNGELELEEFMESIQDPDIMWRMRQIELPVDEAAELFSVIDGDGSRSLHLTEFLEGCTKLKGPAMSKDLFALNSLADALSNRMEELASELFQAEQMIQTCDIISVRLCQRFAPSMVSCLHRRAAQVGGSAPVVHMKPEMKGTCMDTDLSFGNRPCLPYFPELT